MYCDGCGGQLNVGAQFCGRCGKAVVPSGVGAAPVGAPGAYGAPAGGYGSAQGEGRVRRNIKILAGLWMISGILRLVGAVCMMVFGTVFLPFLRGGIGPGGWPFSGRWGMEIPFLGGLFSVVVLLGLFGVLHMVLAWGLFERAPWARTLGIVVGFLALVRFPLGTALGIYTLWVMLPQESGAEYELLVRGGGQWGAAAVSQ
jgi:hypothetical protein